MKAKLLRESNTYVVLPFRRRRLYPEQIADRTSKLVMMFRSSMMEEFEGLGCLKDGKLIYSQWPGYLERDRVNVREWCAHQELGFEIHHTSGHADVKTLVELARGVAAKRVIPIHTDSPERMRELIPDAAPVQDGEWIEV